MNRQQNETIFDILLINSNKSINDICLETISNIVPDKTPSPTGGVWEILEANKRIQLEFKNSKYQFVFNSEYDNAIKGEKKIVFAKYDEHIEQKIGEFINDQSINKIYLYFIDDDGSINYNYVKRQLLNKFYTIEDKSLSKEQKDELFYEKINILDSTQTFSLYDYSPNDIKNNIDSEDIDTIKQYGYFLGAYLFDICLYEARLSENKEFNFVYKNANDFVSYLKTVNSMGIGGGYSLGSASFQCNISGKQEFIIDIPYKDYYREYEEKVALSKQDTNLSINDLYGFYSSDTNMNIYRFFYKKTIIGDKTVLQIYFSKLYIYPDNIKNGLSNFMPYLHSIVFYDRNYLEYKTEVVPVKDNDFIEFVYAIKKTNLHSINGTLHLGIYRKQPPAEDKESLTLAQKNVHTLLDLTEPAIESTIIPFLLKRIENEAIKSSVAAIMSRNMSHNLGSHVLSGTKSHIIENSYKLGEGDGKGMYRLLQYIQERMDFISVIINSANDYYRFNAPLNLKADILDEIAADGRDKRHKAKNGTTKGFLLDYIVKSEGIIRDIKQGKSASATKNIEIILLKDDGELCKSNNKQIPRLLSFTSESNGDNNSNYFNDINFSVPLGINSRHGFLTILENIIRNSAKHNKKYPKAQITSDEEVDTLLISIKIKDDGDRYRITIFDNKEITKEKFEDLKNILDKKILILNKKDNTLNTSYKGIKEMLICSAWLQSENDIAWSVIESESGKNRELISFEEIDLSEIKQGVEAGINNNCEPEAESKNKNRKQKIESYSCESIQSLGVTFSLPKHKFICKKILYDRDDLYSIPSSEFYIIDNRTSDLSNEDIKFILPNVILENIDTEEGFVETADQLKTTLLRCYQSLESSPNSILINYDSQPQGKDSPFIYREKVSIESVELGRNKDVCLFINHNDTPEIFASNYNVCKSIYGNHIKFIEGISGGSYNYNLLINAPLTQLDYYRINRSCNLKIAIIDERIFDKYKNIKFGTSFVSDNDIVEYNNEINKFREGKSESISKDLRSLIMKHLNLRKDSEDSIYELDNWLMHPESNAQIFKNTYNDIWLRSKNIFVYNILSESKILNLSDAEVSKVEPKIDFISVHYGIIEKLKEEQESFKNAFYRILKSVLPSSDLGTTRYTIHSGRGGVAEVQKDIPFLPISIIESQLEDSKFKLSQLFLNLKYKKQDHDGRDSNDSYKTV